MLLVLVMSNLQSLRKTFQMKTALHQTYFGIPVPVAPPTHRRNKDVLTRSCTPRFILSKKIGRSYPLTGLFQFIVRLNITRNECLFMREMFGECSPVRNETFKSWGDLAGGM